MTFQALQVTVPETVVCLQLLNLPPPISIHLRGRCSGQGTHWRGRRLRGIYAMEWRQTLRRRWPNILFANLGNSQNGTSIQQCMYMYMDLMSDDTNWSTNLKAAFLHRSHQTKPSIKTSIASEFIVKLPATDKHPEK